MSVRLIVSDIDGTLLRSDATISAFTAETIAQVQKRGIPFAVCSGRFPEHADVILRTFGVQCIVCGNNGATLWSAETDTVLIDHFFPRDSAERMCQVAEQMGLSYVIFARKAILATNDDALWVFTKHYGPALERDYGIRFLLGREKIDDFFLDRANKFYFNRCTQAQREEFSRRMGDTSGIEITTSGLNNMEIIPAGCNKGSGVIDLAKSLDVSLADVMAIGDYENDVPMLQAVGWSVAMGNTLPEIKAQTRFVTDTNDADGVAKALLKYVL